VSEQELNREWASSQIEAWVDGSLRGVDRERMRAALQRDPELRAAAERAAAIYHALHAQEPAALPQGLRRRLLAIPKPAVRRVQPWMLPALVAAGVAALAVAAWLALPTAPPPPDERMAAIADFELAVHYLNKSARITQVEVTRQVGTGLRDAWVTSRESIEKSTQENGG
jgi:anti-sigma factor RsiW